MANFDVTNPSANQILVYDEISQSFINTDLPTSSGTINNAVNLGNDGSNIFKNVSGGDTLRFRTLVGVNGITLTDYSDFVEISFDGDANSINGYSDNDFLKIENAFSDVDVIVARDNLDVYSIGESHEMFMITNDSNIPDLDNVYDLGSNGRRYADIYAVTFHGTATNADKAEQLDRNNATDGQVLTWLDSNSRWVPKTPKAITITGAEDVHRTNLEDRSILRYNANMNRWEPEVLELGSGSGGSISDMQNVGGGLNVFRDTTGFVANFRSFRGGDNTSLRYNVDESEIVIDVDVPQTTDDLPEGDNLYYTTVRFDNAFNQKSLSDIGDVQNGTPSLNQGLVWDGTQYTYRDIAININSTNDIPEGNANLYFTDSRVVDVIDDYLVDVGIELNQLSNVNTSPSTDQFLSYENNEWVSKDITLSVITEINIDSVNDNDILVWDEPTAQFISTSRTTELIELNETTDSQHFNDTSFNTKISNITSDDISEGSNNQYLSNNNLLTLINDMSVSEFSDVDISTVNNEDILVWNSTDGSFITQSITDLIDGGENSIFDISEIGFDEVEISDGDILVWDSANGVFINSAPLNDIGSLDDVTLTGLVDQQVLVYNGSVFENVDYLPFELDTTLNDQLLVWEDGQFVNKSLSEINNLGIAINDLDDVSISSSSIVDGDSLVWDSGLGVFVTGPSAQSIDISSINGMDIDNINPDQGIRWDGTQFVRASLPFFADDSYSDEDVLSYDNTSSAFIPVNKWENMNIQYSVPADGYTFVFSESLDQFEMRGFSVFDLSDVNEPLEINDNSDYVFRWSEENETFNFYELRVVVDILNDLNDVSVDEDTISEGQIIAWNDSEEAFMNVDLSVSLSQLDDFDDNVPTETSLLQWNTNSSLYEAVNVLDSVPVENNTLSNNTFTGNTIVNEFWQINDSLNVDSGTSQISLAIHENKFHDITISENTDIYIEEINNTESYGAIFSYVILHNPDDYTVTFNSDSPVTFAYLNPVNFNGDTYLLFLNDGTEDWKILDVWGQFKENYPTLNLDNYSDNDFLTIVNDEIVPISGLSGITLENINYSIFDGATNTTIEPSDGIYQTLSPSSDTSYSINDLSSLNGVYEFNIIITNPDNYVLSFDTQGSGIIEYVGMTPSNYNGKYMIKALTLNGTDWIFDVNEIVQ